MPTSQRGRPRDPALDTSIVEAAVVILRERGYAGMSLEAVAASAGTTVPSLRRRYRNKSELAAAVIDRLRVTVIPEVNADPREDALAILDNFGSNLRRPSSMATVGTILAEEHRNPTLLEHFRTALVTPRRDRLRLALVAGVERGFLPSDLDVDVAVNVLIGSFYARYVSDGTVPPDWPRRVLNLIWPDARSAPRQTRAVRRRKPSDGGRSINA